jgi:hypothetical protein
MTDFSDFLNALDSEEFEETPAAIEEFVTSKKYLGLPPLSSYQYTMIRASSQVYKRETLHKIYGADEGEKIFKQTCNEVILQLGKGSGKDYTSTIACAYIVHLLLCLKDPAVYYGKPPGDAIDIINIAINAVQANRVFFKGFNQRIEKSPWFQGRYIAKANSIEFDKEITVHSGHSQRESWEGYNVLVVILDEISGFDLESTSGNEQAKTASSIYKMYKASVTSRFPDFGKLVLLSFPRFKMDYIQQRYNEVIAEKEVVLRHHRFKVDPDLPDGTEGNEFEMEWEEDHIVSYKVPRIFALKRPTWEINPTRKIEDFTEAFYTDPTDALSRFACMPPDATDAFFKNRAVIEKAFSNPKLNVDLYGRFDDDFRPNPEKTYFMHVDLAQKHDHCAVALSHVDGWVTMKIGEQYKEAAPRIIVDAVRFWTPTASKSVDFTEVKDYITSVRDRGFNLKMVTFDRWNSHDMMQQLGVHGIKTEILSVAKKHYEDMSLTLTEERLHGPRIQLLIDELLQLRIVRDKVDHPRKGSKDLSDAVCGAVYNAIALTPPDADKEVEIYTYSGVFATEIEQLRQESEARLKRDKTIRMPERKSVPTNLREFMGMEEDEDYDDERMRIDSFRIL